MNARKFAVHLTAVAMAAAPLCAPSLAGEITPTPKAPLPATTACDDLWNAAILYKNETNPILQEFALQGLFQVQYATGSSNQGNFTSGDLQSLGTDTWGNLDVRRWYMGVKSTLFHHLKLQGQAVINPDWGPVYCGLFDAYASWGIDDQVQLYAGKYMVSFTKEYQISSREIVTLERSMLANQLSPGQLTGAWVNGKNVAGFWSYELGIYGADIQEDFSEFQGGVIVLGKIGYDLASVTGLKKAAAGLHWMHSTDPGDAGAKPYDNSFALYGEMKQGRWAATTDLIYATGKNDLTGAVVPNAWGINIIPTYDITEKLQLSARYQFASSDQNNGLSLQSRYERTAPDLAGMNYKGNQYQAAYLGLNYYLCCQKLKLMTGVEYAHMQDDAYDGGEYDGWTWTSGLRMYF